jgi:uncharacterized protein
MRRDIEFGSGGERVRGWLYTPDGGSGPFPAVVMAGGWCYVKELVQPHVAERVAATGLAAILFDYRNFGSSDGARRQHIDPNAQIEDYRNAISFAETLDEVDAGRIGVWGLSYSGGHALIRRFQQLLLDDRRARFLSGEDGFLPHAARDPAVEVSTWPFPETYETFLELKQHEAPAYENRSTIESAELLMSYDVGPFLPRLLDVPTQVIVAEHDDLTLWDLEIEAYNRIPTAKKRLVVIGGSTHMTLYSDRSLLAEAASAASDWYAQHLLAGG